MQARDNLGTAGQYAEKYAIRETRQHCAPHIPPNHWKLQRIGADAVDQPIQLGLEVLAQPR
jgi:hypothetical protein